MTKVIVERMTNPFMIEEGSNEDNRQPLINTFTKTTAPQDVTDCLFKVRQYDQQALENFVRSSRLNNQEVDLFDILPKPKLKTFASMNKTVISYQLSQRGRSVQNSPVGSGRNVGP